MLGIFKKKTPGTITISLNAKLQPIHRGELEDAFTDVCEKEGFDAEIVGGGTLMDPSGEVRMCDIEIQLKDMTSENIEFVKGLFEAMLAPKGSYFTLSTDEKRTNFGNHEGLGLYLNGTDLPDEVYSQCDSNHVYEECERLVENIAQVNSHWQGPTETALYMYGTSFQDIKKAIQPLLDSYPLCQKARVEQIA